MNWESDTILYAGCKYGLYGHECEYVLAVYIILLHNAIGQVPGKGSLTC